jgi:phytoene dehydrogenase-like protein
VNPRTRYDAVIVGAGHNGLVAAVLLARAGRSVLVLERGAKVGGAAVSGTPFGGVEVRLSRYAYLVSLFPASLLRSLGVNMELRRRSVSSYTPVGDAGLLDRGGELDRGVSELLGRVATRVFPTLTRPLLSRPDMRALVGEDWEPLFEQPLSGLLESRLASDVARGVALTDALIGTFAAADDPGLRQNRCFLYHVVGGPWDVPVGGMGRLTEQLRDRALAAGAEIRTRTPVEGLRTDGSVAEVETGDGECVEAGHVLANVAPQVLARLLGAPPTEPAPEGAQLKINMLLRRLPRLRDRSVSVLDAFAGTFHVNESYEQLGRAYSEAARGEIPRLPPCELYCHSLSDPSILSDELRAAGAHTLTLFGLHMPARLFTRPGAKERAVEATLRSMDSVLAEPLEECLWRDGDGRPCLEALTPLELEHELGLPGGHIFHRDLSWPFAEADEEVGRWGVETEWANVFVCGAGARRGGGVSGIPGHNAAMAVLEADRGLARAGH